MGLHVFNRNEGAGPWWRTAQWTFSPTAIGNVTKAALRERRAHAGPDWAPDAGWPERIG